MNFVGSFSPSTGGSASPGSVGSPLPLGSGSMPSSERSLKVLVNEIAPRPHNSGHYSIESSYTNQFEQHLRAILGLPLGNTDSKVAGIMVNLVGEEGYNGQVLYENIEKIMELEVVTPHIYGKKLTRPFRKMGHVTIVHKDLGEARRVAEMVKNTIRVISK